MIPLKAGIIELKADIAEKEARLVDLILHINYHGTKEKSDYIYYYLYN